MAARKTGDFAFVPRREGISKSMHILRVAWIAFCLPAAALAQEATSSLALPRGEALARMTELPPLVVDAPTIDETFVVGRGYKARVSAEGLEFAALPGPALPLEPLRLQLESVWVGKLELPLATRKIADDGHACVLEHGALREQLELRPDGIEQSFHFAELPARGELTVRLAVDTRLKVAAADDGLCFGDGLHALHYGGALVLDAVGNRIACPSRWIEGCVQITVPPQFVAAAVLPLVIDPLLWAPKTWALGTGTGENLSVDSPDFAYSLATQSWLLVWRVQNASDDHDVYARRFDPSWLHLGPAQAVDVSTFDWATPKVAWVLGAGQWHIIGYQRNTREFGPLGFPSAVGKGVYLRRWNSAGAVGAKLAVGSLASLHPESSTIAIGGDPVTAAGGVSLVAWWSTEFSLRVRYRLVGADGSMTALRELPPGPSYLNVFISKSNGGGRWLVAWSQIGEFRCAFIDRLGNLVPTASGSTLLLASVPWSAAAGAAELSVGSPDLSGVHTVCYPDVGTGSMRLRRVSSTGSMTSPVSLDALAPGWGLRPTVVETDGTRILALTRDGSFLRAALLAYSSGTAAWRSDDDFLVPAHFPANAVVVSSRFVGGPLLLTAPFTIGCSAANATWSVVRVVDYSAPLTGSLASGGGYERIASACSEELEIEPAEVPPTPGTTLHFTLSSGHAGSGFFVGAPADIPLTGICACVLGVDGALILGNRLDVPIPADPDLVGVTIAVQGFTLEGGPCLGQVAWSDSIRASIL